MPLWPKAPDYGACQGDVVCILKEAGLWIRAAERFHDATKGCPEVVETSETPSAFR